VRRKRAGVAALVAGLSMLCACGPSKPETPVERGRRAYMTNCVVCHNPNPNLPGSQGPPIAGSSRELVEARVLHLAYPPGYKPKRTTHAMRALPQLKDRIDDITLFLDQAAKDQNK
jgi:mono/diheme cytochrome c family protein